MRGGARAALALLVLGASLGTSALAEAAVEPGTPVAVAPGVPGNGRAWELVSSEDPVALQFFQVPALAANGEQIHYTAYGLLPGSPTSEGFPSSNFSTRGAGGWLNATTMPPHPELSWGREPGAVAMTPDLASSVWINAMQADEVPEPMVSLYRRAPDGDYAPLVEYDYEGRFLGASVDLQHLFFLAGEHLLPADATRGEGQSIYEIDGSTLRLVDVDENGALLSECGSFAGGAHSISRDGQRIFFATRPSCAGPARVYLREGGTETTEISAPQCALAGCETEEDAFLAGATPSGSSAFVISAQRLLAEDTDSTGDLYRYDVASGGLSLVSKSAGGVDVVPALETVRASGDGSRVYFNAVEQGGGEKGLYLSDVGDQLLVAPNPAPLVEVSRDGRFAVFSTPAALVGGDLDGRKDIYRYDAEMGTVTWISAGPAGGNSPLDTSISKSEATAEALSSHPFRAISEDGNRIFFDTDEQLVAQDRNEVSDVYEWANGNLALLSSGVGALGSTYVNSTPDGATVLFQTNDTLLGRDRDAGQADYYAARIGGGLPEPSAPKSCGSCAVALPGRQARPLPRSAKPPARVIRLERPSTAERRRIVATGWVVLLAEVPKAGRLTATAHARIRGHRRTVAAHSAAVKRPGPTELRMRLSEEARRRLAAGKSLRLRLRVRLSGLDSVRRVGFALGGKRE